MLRPLILALHNDIRFKMGDTHRTVGCVDMLAAGTAGPKCVNADIGVGNINIDGIVDHRITPNAGKARMAAGIAVKGRNANQTVDTGLRLCPAIGIVPLNLDSRRFDARFFAIGLFDQRNLKAFFSAQRIYMRSSMEAQS